MTVYKNPNVRYFNNESACAAGFTLIEVLVALVIIALMLSPLFVSQVTVFHNVLRSTQRIDRTYLMKQFFIDTHLEMEKDPKNIKEVYEKKVENPQTLLKLQRIRLGKESSLKNVPEMMMERVTAQWKDVYRSYEDSLVYYTYEPAPKEKAGAS